MINQILRYGFISLALILLQILLFNNIQFSGYVNPYVYLMIILLLPAGMQPWLILIIAFILGMIIDLPSGTPGLHAFATVLAAFSRPYVLRLIATRDGYETGKQLSMANYGFRWSFLYTIIIVLIHHTALFFLEVFRFDGFFRTILRILLSSLFTAGFILVAEYYRKNR